MPILVTLPAPVGPPPVVVPDPVDPAPPPPAITTPLFPPRRWTLGRPGAAARPLTTDWPYGIRLLKGMTGCGIPPAALTSDAKPNDHGSLFRAIRYTERDVFVPLIVWGANGPEVTARRRELEELLDPLVGPVELTVNQPDGENRSITGYYVGGAEGDMAADRWGRAFQKVGAVIRCLDPWWSTGPVTQEWRLVTATKQFLPSADQFFPVQLGSGQVAGHAVVVNEGDTTAEPIWSVTGPGSNLVVTNDTTGESWSLSGSLSGGQTVVVDTRRSQQTVVDAADGTNLFDRLGTTPLQLWALGRGPNAVSVALDDADADSRVAVTFTPRLRSMG